jgi:hypothetical protein
MYPYGLLGGTFEPDASGTFRAEIAVADPTASRVRWAMRFTGNGSARQGLPLASAERIANDVSRVIVGDGGPPSGELRISHALYSPDWSSPILYSILLRFLVGVFKSRGQAWDADAIKAALLEAIRVEYRRTDPPEF